MMDHLKTLADRTADKEYVDEIVPIAGQFHPRTLQYAILRQPARPL